jgi:hypothetical protein
MDEKEFRKNNKDINNYSSHKITYWFGGLICTILMIYSLATMVVMFGIGTPPETIIECFSMLNENKFLGLLRLDILTVFIMPLYYILFYSIYIALKNHDNDALRISIILIFAGLTLFLATPSVFSYLHLSDKYSLATTELEKSQLLSAGEAILASDMWHGTGAKIGGILMQVGALIISILMLKTNVFTRFTAYIGIFSHGLDLLHILIGFFLPVAGAILMAIGGTLYLVWFPLIGLRLFKLSNATKLQESLE